MLLDELAQRVVSVIDFAVQIVHFQAGARVIQDWTESTCPYLRFVEALRRGRVLVDAPILQRNMQRRLILIYVVFVNGGDIIES